MTDRYLIWNAVLLRRKACMKYWHTFSFHPPVHVHLIHNLLYLREILYTINIWTAVCVFERWEMIARCIWELRKWSVRAREREHFYQRDFAYPAFTNFKLIDNELWLPGKTGRLVTLSLPLRVLRPLFQIASSRFCSLSIHCGCYTD